MATNQSATPSSDATPRPLHPENILDYQTADARWFKRHPNRQYRFRKAYVAEPFAPPGYPVPAAPPGFFVSVIVAQIKPGVRTRARLVHSETPSSANMNNDAWIAAVHRECCPNAVAMGHKMTAAIAKAGGAS